MEIPNGSGVSKSADIILDNIQASKDRNSNPLNENQPVSKHPSNSSLSFVNDTNFNRENSAKNSKKNNLNYENDLRKSSKCQGHKTLLKKAAFFTFIFLACVSSSVIVSLSFRNSSTSAVALDTQFAIFQVNSTALHHKSEAELECLHEQQAVCIPFIPEQSGVLALSGNGRTFSVMETGIFDLSLSITLTSKNGEEKLNVRVCIRYETTEIKRNETCSRASLATPSMMTMNVVDVIHLHKNEKFYVKINCKKKNNILQERSLTRLLVRHYKSRG